MTVKELIEELNKFDENLIVVYSSQEDTYEPEPIEKLYNFDTYYCSGTKLVSILKNTKFVQL